MEFVIRVLVDEDQIRRYSNQEILNALEFKVRECMDQFRSYDREGFGAMRYADVIDYEVSGEIEK